MRLALVPLVIAALAAPVSAADTLRADVQADNSYIVALYKELHQNPEIAFQETKTASRLAGEMKKLGFDVTTGVGKTGLVAVMKNGPGPVLLIRTDMDGLPVAEETGLPYVSKATATTPAGLSSQTMHACGHDIHMASWIGTARRLSAMKTQWAGTLVMIAQPAEEAGSGARAMLADGLYTRFPKPQYALALHDHAALPAGMIAYSNGWALANVDSVDMTIRGVGGHGAYPHTTKDPIVIAARTVTALQTLVSRENDPQSPAVVTVGSIHGGTSYNIIPDEVRMQLTVRSYTDETRDKLLSGIKRVAEGEAIAAGVPKDRLPIVKAKEEFTPATFNTDKLTRRVADLFTARFGKDRVIQQSAVMGGEDFSEYYRADKSIESMIFWLGAVGRDKWEAAKGNPLNLPSLHSSKFAPDPVPTLLTGVEAMTSAALDILGKKGG